MNDAERKAAAQAMLEAARTVTPCTQLSKTYAGMTIEDAYAVQAETIRARVAAGATIRGHKIGLTSKAMQAASGVTEPDYGVLLDDMFYAEGSSIPASKFIVPRIEVELAFVLSKPLKGPGVTLFDVLGATDYVVPALELIDGRSKYPRIITDNIADNAAAAGVVYGGRPVRPMDVDLRWVGALIYKNGTIEESGVSAAVLGHPALGIAWLANKVGPFGVTLEAGHFLLAGSFTRPVPVAKGDSIHVEFGPLGSIAVRFD